MSERDKRGVEAVVGVEWVLSRVVKEGFPEKVTTEQRPDLDEPCRILGEETSGHKEQLVQKP